MRGRGLKLALHKGYLDNLVAPHAGAWIETIVSLIYFLPQYTVAPHAGAWIETSGFETTSPAHGSPPMRGRGLKPSIRKTGGYNAVAPHAGAWIETLLFTSGLIFILVSPPMRGRGLKLESVRPTERVCRVAPHAGAWIETHQSPLSDNLPDGRPPCGGVD